MEGRELGRWLRARREELGLSLAQVHLRSNGLVGSSYLSMVERSLRQPGPETLLALAPIYGVDVKTLYELAGYLPAGTAAPAPQPEPPKPVTWKDIEERIRHSDELTLEQRRDLIRVWKAQYDALAQAAADKTRRRGRKASG